MNPIEELLDLTGQYLNRPDLIQGPGGNTSVKDSEGKMYIKASGFRFEEMNAKAGISCVNYQPITDFLDAEPDEDKSKSEQGLIETVQQNKALQADGSEYPRPSMETGFHASLKKYVVHTHSVYANLINCASSRNELSMGLSGLSGLKIALLDFYSPGFELSYRVKQTLLNKPETQVFLLSNHGIITHADTVEEAVNLHQQIDELTRTIFNISDTYPSTSLTQIDENTYQASDPILGEWLQTYKCKPEFFQTVLFPDQTVFFDGNVSSAKETPKAIHLAKNPEYRGSRRQAESMHETLTAYMFIWHHLMLNDIAPVSIDQTEQKYIQNMEMEKHRKKLMK